MILVYHGKKPHIVPNYTDRGTYATVELNDQLIPNIQSTHALFNPNRINARNELPGGATRTIQSAHKTVKLVILLLVFPTLRANGHDFDKTYWWI